MHFWAHWSHKFLGGGIKERLFQGSSHGSHGLEGVISGSFWYRKMNFIENGCDCLFGLPHDFRIISIKSVAFIFQGVPQSDRVFFGEGFLRNRLTDRISPQRHEERRFSLMMTFLHHCGLLPVLLFLERRDVITWKTVGSEIKRCTE